MCHADRSKNVLVYSMLGIMTATAVSAGAEEATGEDEALREEVIVTARRVAEAVFTTPFSADIITQHRIAMANFRSTPEIFREIPGALVQKTAHGQGSPYIRGFTGFRNLFMVDGIRLNNATFREGPNQYWATVNIHSISRVEVVRGPKSVLYGSDAIGGTVNVLSLGPQAWRQGAGVEGSLHYRYGHAENSHVGGGTVDVPLGDSGGVFIAGSSSDFGDIQSGAGKLPNTGYNEWALDSKLEYQVTDNIMLQAAHSRVDQDAVPRTHKTLHAVPFAGTSIGSELRRDLYQNRELSYLRIDAQHVAQFSDAVLTLYNQRQGEQRKRLRSLDRYDEQQLNVDTWGMNMAAQLATQSLGVFTIGGDWARDSVDSSSSSNPVQGPVADDSSYDWGGVFVQNRYKLSHSVDLTTGLRFAWFDVGAGSVADPSDGSETAYSDDWQEPVASVRLGWSDTLGQMRIFGGISQGFRAPNLSDLTRFDSARSNEFEIPSTGLEPERFTQYELGARYRNRTIELDGAVYYTDIRDQIQRVLTGRSNVEGEMEVTRANIGDGEIYGAEIRGSWYLANGWKSFGHLAWLDGEIGNENQLGGSSVEDYHSRMMPTNLRLGLRYDSVGRSRWWLEVETLHAQKADRLSLRDKDDTQRIPPGGTPSFTVWHLRGGWVINDALELNLALENLADENYRVHGSGQNETGRNFIAAVDYRF
jgi:outer membrane receptor for ferrienterochelin and colicin